jgi:hypothetical protein
MSVYRKIKQTPPESLYESLLSTATARELSTDIHFSQGPSWISFENPAGSLARSPGGNLLAFRVEWTNQNLVFSYRLDHLDNSVRAPVEIGELILDTYVDLNNIPRAGSTALLEGREAFTQARDAWEFAVIVSGWGAFLYRPNPLGAPSLIARMPVLADTSKGDVRVLLPREMLRGNPGHWGYIVAALAADPRTTPTPPPKPRPHPTGGSILGLLATLEQQKALLEGPAGRKRLAALRARPLKP